MKRYLAKRRLAKSKRLFEQGDWIGSMRAIGMNFSWLEEMPMTEAVEVFQVRVADTKRLIKGEK
jgi:hypothetical protein